MEVARRDPNFLHPEAARKAMLAVSMMLIIIILLVWFIWTCKKNSDMLRKEREAQMKSEMEHAELRSFS